MARKNKRVRDDRLDKLVVGRAPIHINQTGSGFHGDRRTNGERDRSNRERKAIEDQDE